MNKYVLGFGHSVIVVISSSMGHSITITLYYLSRQAKGPACAGVDAGNSRLEGWKETEEMLSIKKDGCEIEERRARDAGTEGGNHSAIRALSLGPVFITVQLL